ncbi:MAG: acyltransferase family protein [Phycisphaera sp.]|nr:acyltransferase family protein [Phycisphaera sp.]
MTQTLKTPHPPSAHQHAMRVAGMLLVVAFHSGVPYFSHPVVGLLWAIREQTPSTPPRGDWLFLLGYTVVLPLFFAMAGCGAEYTVHRFGLGRFVQTRWRSLVVVFLISLVILLPLMYLLWGIGMKLDGRATWRQWWRMQYDKSLVNKNDLLGLAHLWFMSYLIVSSAAYALIRAAICRPPLKRLMQRIGKLNPRVLCVLFFTLVPLATAGVLVWDDSVVMRFYNTFFPRLAQACYFTCAFLTGTGVYHLLRRSPRWTRFWPMLFGLGAAALYLGLPWINSQLDGLSQHARVTTSMSDRIVLAVCLSVGGWGIALGAWGLAATRLAHPDRATLHFSASAFWVYLVHVPIVVMLQIGLFALERSLGLAWPEMLKWGLVFAGGLGLSVASEVRLKDLPIVRDLRIRLRG